MVGKLVILEKKKNAYVPITPSAELTDEVCAAVTNGEVLALLRWKLDMGGRLALMSGERECAG